MVQLTDYPNYSMPSWIERQIKRYITMEECVEFAFSKLPSTNFCGNNSLIIVSFKIIDIKESLKSQLVFEDREDHIWLLTRILEFQFYKKYNYSEGKFEWDFEKVLDDFMREEVVDDIECYNLP